MAKRTNETITLGSGTLYAMEFTGTIPENTEIEKEENRLLGSREELLSNMHQNIMLQLMILEK